MPARRGYQTIWSGIHAAPGVTSPPAHSIAIRFRWRPACRASSRPETCAIPPSNEYRAEWVKAAWPSLSSINTFPYRRAQQACERRNPQGADFGVQLVFAKLLPRPCRLPDCEVGDVAGGGVSDIGTESRQKLDAVTGTHHGSYVGSLAPSIAALRTAVDYQFVRRRWSGEVSSAHRGPRSNGRNVTAFRT